MKKGSMSDFIRYYKETLFALVMILFFALIIFFTKDIRLLVVNTTVDARFWPKVVGIGGCIFSVILLVQSIIEGKTLKKKEEAGVIAKPEEKGGFFSGERIRPLVTLLLLAMYIAGIQIFGFLMITIVYLFLQFLLLSDPANRKILQLVIVDVVFTVAVYLLFRYGFQMMLPAGSIWG